MYTVQRNTVYDVICLICRVILSRLFPSFLHPQYVCIVDFQAILVLRKLKVTFVLLNILHF